MAKAQRPKKPQSATKLFYNRLLLNGGWASLIIVVSLAAGVAGYHGFENLPWVDALLNASMILGGMGPVDPVHTLGGKLFASFYALYSGLLIIGLMGVFLGIIFHHVLHKFHEDRV